MIEMNTREHFQGFFAFSEMTKQLITMGENKVAEAVFDNIVNTLVGEAQ